MMQESFFYMLESSLKYSINASSSKPMLFVPVSATFSEQTHRFEVFVPVFGSFSEQISIRTGYKDRSARQRIKKRKNEQ